MRNILLAAAAVAALFVTTAAMADEFSGQQAQGQTQSDSSINAYMDQQAAGSELADPTAPHSLRSHGHP